MASVIKSTLGARKAATIAFNFEDVAQHANLYVGEVQARANEIIADARAQAAAVTQRAEEDGRQAALRAVEKVLDEKVGQRMETLLPALEKVVSQLIDEKQAWLRHWEAISIQLAAKIAERVVRRELTRDPQITVNLVREALEMSAGSPQLKIALNPEDFETLGGNVKRLCAEIARTAQAEVVSDVNISPGGCRLETQHGRIDQQIETQLARISAELIGSDEGEIVLELANQIERIIPTAMQGSVVRIVGLSAAVAEFPAPIGAIVEIERETGKPALAEVIGFRDDLTLLYPYENLNGVRRGNRVRLRQTYRWLRVGPELLGRVVDAQGKVIDGRPQPALVGRTELNRRPPPSVERPRIHEPLSTGIRSIDGLLTCGKGQRMGIFAGSGVGKSVALGMMARYTSADVNVIALVGERGREVNEFLERDLGPVGLQRSVVVVATSDEPALRRVQAAQTATAIAEFFRDEGKDVLLLMDSVTRFAMAQREIGLAAGEPPTTRGYPPSVFAMLPQLVERAGRSARGSITGFYSVLVEGDDPQEPICDTVRGLLDGHTWLSRKLASRAHFPAVDVLESISRLMSDITPRAHQDAAQMVRELMAVYRDHEDLISIGAYRRGANRQVDLAIEMQESINKFLKQRVDEPGTVDSAQQGLLQLLMQAKNGTSAMKAADATKAPVPTDAARALR